MAGGQEFIRCWEALSRPGATATEKTEAYAFLTSYLKETTVTPDFISTLCHHQKLLTRQILGDITPNSSCEHAALQTLGYCLHNPDFAVSFSKEEVTMTVEAICGVIAQEGTDRNTCTRALWCLANQNFHVSQCSHMVAMVISTVGAAVRSQHYGTPTVDNEALNLLVRLSQQCPLEFIRMAMLWYRPIFHLLLCKITKLQRRALNLATSFEEKLCDNHELLHWLVKELKEGVVVTMVKMLTEKGRDHCLILTIWSHFVTILGKTLHKHGSFLNELLKVVEMGFKHKLFVVQVAAYSAWRTLISNFSQEIALLTSQKRLKLLLMPLLASAVRERHEQVEHARLLTWWHLIGCLGAKRSALFKQICIPFLMFCLGLDPKLDISQLATSVNSTTTLNHQSHSHTTPVSHPHTMPMSHSNTTPVCSTPTPTTSNASGVSQDRVELSIAGQKSLSTPLSLVASPATPRRTPSPNKHGSNRYQTVPSLPMVVSGCHAVLQFLGVGMGQVAQSLIEQELVGDVTFPKLVVPVEVAQFFIIFLDRLLLCSVHYGSLIKGNMVDLVVCHLATTIINTLNQDKHKDPRWSSLPIPLLEMLLSGRFEGHVEVNTKKELISQLCLLPNRTMTSVNSSNGMVVWKTLLGELLKSKKIDHNSVWFQGNWKNIVTVATTAPNRLSQFQYLIDRLEEIVRPDYLERSSLSSMWSTLASFFMYFIKETSQVNGGTSLDPDFTVARRILQFPFQQILMSVTKSCVILTMDTWKALYDVVNIHVSLLVKGPNACAEMICSDLYNAYGQNAKVDASTLDSRGQVIKFDVYQNAVAMALQCVASKLNWGTTMWSTSEDRGQMRGGERGRRAVEGEKCIRSLMSLLAWQLATFWDNMQKPVINLGQLTTPYTLMDTLSLLYRSFPSSELIRFATELIAEPLATLWEKILTSQPPSLKSRPKPPSDLHEEVTILWKNIMTCFQARYTQPFDSRLLSLLSPLLVVTLSSKKQSLVNPTLTFWSLTFDKAPHLTYPYKLHDTFSSYLKVTKCPLQLRLPGFDTSKEVLSIEDSIPTTSVSQFSELQSQVEERAVVLPNPSPQKGVRGSFLNRLQSPRKPPPPSTPEKSPAAKSLDEILARSRARQVEQRPTDMGNGGSPQRGVKKAAFPVRRKLSLSEEETYVAVTPPAKKCRLLTEHQKEKMRERRDIPTLYNALDPSQDSTQPPLTEDQPLPDSPSGSGDDPIIIPESEVSPATPVSLRRSSVHYQPTPPPPSTATLPYPPPLPPSSTPLPPEAMDTNTLSEFPIPISRSDSTPISQPSFVPKPTSTPAPPDNAIATRKNIEVINVDKTPPLGTHPQEPARSMSPHVVTLAPANIAMATHTRSTVTSQPVSHPSNQTDSNKVFREVERSVQHATEWPAEPRQSTQPKAYLRLKKQPPTAAVTTSTELYSGVQALSSSSCAPPKLYHTPQPANSLPRNTPPSLVLVNSLNCPQPTQSTVTFNLAASTTTMHQAEIRPSFLPVGPKLHSDTAFQRAVVATQASTAVPALLTHPITHPPVAMTTVPPPTGSVPTNITTFSGPLLASQTNTRIQDNQMNNAILDATVQQLAQQNYQKWCENDRKSSTSHPVVPTSIHTSQVRISPHVSPQMLAGSTPIAFVTVNDNPEYLVVSHDRTCQPGLPTAIHPSVSSSTNTMNSGRRYVSATVVSSRLHGGQDSYPSAVSAESLQKLGDGSSISTEGLSTKQSIVTVSSMVSSARQQTPTTLPPPLSTTGAGSKVKLLSSGIEGEKGSAKSTPSLQLKRRGKGRKLASQSAAETPSELLQASAEERKVIKKAKKRGYKPKEQGPPEQRQNDEAVLVTEVSESVGPSEAQSLEPAATPLTSTTTAESSLSQPDTRGQVSCESEDPLVGLSSKSVQNSVAQTVESTPSSTTGNTLENEEVEIIKVEISRTAPDGSDVAAESKSDQQTTSLSEGVSGREHNSSEEGKLQEDVSPTEATKQFESETPSKPSEDPDSSPPHQENSKAAQDPNKLGTAPSTPTPENEPIPSPRDTPAGILKRTSQFDTPFSASKSRHVQFASSPVMIDPEELSKNGGEESFKTPKHRRGSRNLQGTYSSRRTLQLSHTTPTKLIMVNKPPSTPPPSSTEPIYPPLASCLSPVEQILPALIPSNRSTHGLVQLTRARNICTVGNLSSLTQQQVQTLPIKSPKVETLKTALRNFEQQFESKRRPSVEDEVATTVKQSKASQPSSSSSVDSSEQPNGGSEERKVSEKTAADLSASDSQDLLGPESSWPTESAVTLSTPDSQLVPEATLKESVSEQSSNKAGKVASEQSDELVEQSKSDDAMDETSTDSTVEKFQESNSNPQRSLDSTPPSPKATTQQTEPATTDIDSTQLPLEERLTDNAASESGAMDIPENHTSPVEEVEPMETEPSNLSSAAEVPVAVIEVPAQRPHAEPNATNHPATVVIHDHSYCSQKASSSSLQPQESSNCSDNVNVATKLSSVNNDHTYCYSSDLDLEEPSSLADEQTQLEESLLAQPEPICSSPAHPDAGVSQELFSCNLNNADETVENDQEQIEPLDSNSTSPSSSESHHADCSQRVATKDTQTPSPELLNTAINTDLTSTTITVPPLLSVSNLQSVVGEITANTGILAEAGVEQLLALQEKLFELQQLVQQSLSKTMRERP